MKISKEKKDKISEHILEILYSTNPKAMFTSEIAKEVARDEEFVKALLTGLATKRLVLEVKKNPKGVDYLRRSRWKLSDSAYMAYRQHQHDQKNTN